MNGYLVLPLPAHRAKLQHLNRSYQLKKQTLTRLYQSQNKFSGYNLTRFNFFLFLLAQVCRLIQKQFLFEQPDLSFKINYSQLKLRQ